MRTTLGKVLFALIVMALCFWPTWLDLWKMGLSGAWQHYTSSLMALVFAAAAQLFWLLIGAAVIKTVDY